MAFNKLENASYLATDWEDETITKNYMKKGWLDINFTNIEDEYNLDVPALSAGSVLDLDGVWYVNDAELAVTGTPVDGVNYIIITGGASTAALSYTTTVPAWSDSKRGFYVGSARCVMSLFYRTSSSTFWNKFVVTNERIMASSQIEIPFLSNIDYYNFQSGGKFGTNAGETAFESKDTFNFFEDPDRDRPVISYNNRPTTGLVLGMINFFTDYTMGWTAGCEILVNTLTPTWLDVPYNLVKRFIEPNFDLMKITLGVVDGGNYGDIAIDSSEAWGYNGTWYQMTSAGFTIPKYTYDARPVSGYATGDVNFLSAGSNSEMCVNSFSNTWKTISAADTADYIVPYIEKLTVILGTTPTEGFLGSLNITSNIAKFWDGTAWITIAS